MRRLFYENPNITYRHHIIYVVFSILSVIIFSVFSAPQTLHIACGKVTNHTFTFIQQVYAAQSCGCNQNPDIIYSDVTPGTPYGDAITTMTESCVFQGFSPAGCATIPTAWPCFGGGKTMARNEAIMAITRYHINIRKDWVLKTALPQYFADYDSSYGQMYYEIQTAKFYGLVGGDTCASIYGAANIYGAAQCIDPFNPWLFGFHGVLASDPKSLNGPYNFLASSGTITRGLFAQGMYDYYNAVDNPTIQLACAPPSTPPATTGNIINLNFGLTNSTKWMQFIGFDARFEDGYTTNIPDSPAFGPPLALRSLIDSTPTTGGVFFTGNNNGVFQTGSTSVTRSDANQRVVGGTAIPEEYTTSKTNLHTSYVNLLALAQSSGQTVIPIPCDVTACDLHTINNSGIYQATGDLTIINSTYNQPNNKIIILIGGHLHINGFIHVTGNNSLFIFSAANDIIINQAVGESGFVDAAPNGAPYTITGHFTAGKNFTILGNDGNCATTDHQLIILGSVAVNASLGSGPAGKFDNHRDLCLNNTNPAVVVKKRLDYLINAPDFLRIPSLNFKEEAP